MVTIETDFASGRSPAKSLERLKELVANEPRVRMWIAASLEELTYWRKAQILHAMANIAATENKLFPESQPCIVTSLKGEEAVSALWWSYFYDTPERKSIARADTHTGDTASGGSTRYVCYQGLSIALRR